MNRPLLMFFALVSGLAAGCGAGDLPVGLSEQEAQRMGIDEGIAGRAALRSGNCAPGWLSDCDVSPPGVSLRAVAISGELLPVPEDVGPCRLSIVESDQYLSFPLASLSAADAPDAQLDDDTYALALAPGRYALVLADAQGCAQCWRRGMDAAAGTTGCEAVEVLSGRVTVADVLLDEAAE